MIWAEDKKQENIAEYMIYMYQTEDLIRSFQFDLDALIEHYVRPQLADDSFLEANRAWYAELLAQMKREKLTEKGHLHQLNEILVELSYLHNTLLNIANDQKYRELCERAEEHIAMFREKSNLKEKNNIEVMFHAMYMKLLLRIKKQEISSETEESFDAMRICLAYLSRIYHSMKRGDMSFMNNN
ncbi:MAG: DUF4924 family protein [Bacteroidetes bacterium]|nr:MAG: DUF4924 family protein [Bacteroidota bacterium]